MGQARSETKLDAVCVTGTFGTQVGCCLWDRHIRNTSWMLFQHGDKSHQGTDQTSACSSRRPDCVKTAHAP